MAWKTKGMNQDLSVSAFNPEFSFENINLRLSTNENNTQLSWVNERGTLPLHFKDPEGNDANIVGVPIGCAVINHQIILFATNTNVDNPDYIYKIEKDDSINPYFRLTQLYNGNLNFSTDYPIETHVSYESELVQKVYWTDGRGKPKPNQPRVINVAASSEQRSKWNDNYFNFIPTLQLEEDVIIEKQLGASGMFAPGVIQYAFTYYNKYGQESNIFYTTPLQYISYKDRGASPEDKVENAFKITVNNVDTNFDYLRIYSIQRTSLDATPICKRIQDIAIDDMVNRTASFIDTGITGNTIDPTELLYKGGEIVTAQTMEQKDNTLFLGNIEIQRPEIEVTLKNDIKNAITINNVSTRSFKATAVSYGSYTYYNQLTSKGLTTHDSGKSVPCCGFKTGDYYRLGVQFQHESGKWSDPIHITDNEGNDFIVKSKPNENNGVITIPNFEGTISGEIITTLKNEGYKRIRPVVVFPNMLDRNIICQGVTCPTIFTQTHHNDNDLYAQSSWFFRPKCDDANVSTTTNNPKCEGTLYYTQRNIEQDFPVSGKAAFSPTFLRKVEVEGDFDSNNQFQINDSFKTLHSPDIEFDNQLSLMDFTETSYGQVGVVQFNSTMSDIDIQTESSTVSNSGSGFLHKAFTSNGAAGIVAGLFYDDYLVDDRVGDNKRITAYPHEKASAKWLIYPWQSNGSLNNDINRPTDKGNATAVLKKKIISNLRYANTTLKNYEDRDLSTAFIGAPQMFYGEEDTILKINNKIYKGNIDTLLMPDNSDGKYLALDGYDNGNFNDTPTPFTSIAWQKTFSREVEQSNQNGLRTWVSPKWVWGGSDIGDDFVDLSIRKSPVRMKYKSTPHIVMSLSSATEFEESTNQLAIVEIKQATNHNTRFGGKSVDALKENLWIPCGESVPLNENSTAFYYDYGDTYFQRYDCLKTYAYTREDPNQIIEIGSFMLETHINIDGRYDRNRGQINNLNMSPSNFNLLNTIYTQKDNFFTYTIQDNDIYKNSTYPNQITWSKTKQNNADVDLWNNITLANTLELDGDKGKVVSINRLNDQLICFQDEGISQILYNENTQISTSEGVPIEIANSGKVQGKRYISSNIGCSNKWSICNTSIGIYFIDSIGKNIFLFNGQLNNLSNSLGFNTWAKQHIPEQSVKWDPVGFNNFKTHYDIQNQDVLFTNKDIALAYSEKFGVFTSFYNYGSAPWLANVDNTELWFTKPNTDLYSAWKHQQGDYNSFFGVSYPYQITLIANSEPQIDKVFTNLEFRANIDAQNENEINLIPFDFLETWDEYQHGIANINTRNGHTAFQHHKNDGTASLNRKFRIWRCDIPRNNCLLDSNRTGNENYSTDAELKISRFNRTPSDRMRNTWLYLKLSKKENTNHRVEIHDMIATYFT